jgi:hypothetical protein
MCTRMGTGSPVYLMSGCSCVLLWLQLCGTVARPVGLLEAGLACLLVTKRWLTVLRIVPV